MKENRLLKAMGQVDEKYVEEASFVRQRKKRGWVKWCAMAACLCLIIGAVIWPKGPRMEVKEAGSLEEIGGNLVAERLVNSGAETTKVRLSYVKGGDASDPAAWNALSITGDYNGQDFTLDCDYSREGDKKDPGGAYAVTRYGDVEVTIYREESDWSKPFLYRAEFTMDGVTYNLSVHSDDPDDIYAYLDIVLSEPEGSGNQSGATLTDVLGFDVCRVETEEIAPFHHMLHYYVKMDGEDVCVAEQFGYDGPKAWSRDLDGDDVPELICENTYGADGVQRISVYRNNNGVIEEGNIRFSYYKEKFGWNHAGEMGVPSIPGEQYNPEKGVFIATSYYYHGSDNPVTVEFDDGLGPFDFIPFNHQS